MKQLLIVFLLILGVSVPFAQAEVPYYEMANSDKYSEKAVGMFGRGILNAATSFVDMFVQTAEEAKKGPHIVGAFRGFGAGVGCSLMRAGSGIGDILTFWVPDYNGNPISRNYHDCLDKDYQPYEEGVSQSADREGGV